MSNVLITKSNYLVEAGYKLSLNEQRLILSAISKLDARKQIPESNDFEITANDFSKTFNLPIKQAYEVLEDASNRLYERDIKTFDRTENSRTRFRWVDCVKYWDGEAKVTLSFSSRIIPYLTLLHKQFTTYELNQISQLKTAYAIRLYELLVQFLKTEERYLSLKRLRELLELENLYPRFFDIKKRIIEPSIKNINESTNLIVEWDVVKKGRVITGLMFVFQKTPQKDS
jgi:plasmid replication initiation protein